jgi:Delta24-sterol reductase
MKSSLVVFITLLLGFFGSLGYAIFTLYGILDVITVQSLLPQDRDCAELQKLVSYVGDMSISACLLQMYVYTILTIVLIAFAAGSSAGNLAADFPFAFRAAAWCRTPVLMLFVVPMSYIMRMYYDFEIKFNLFFPSNETHDSRVSKIVQQVVDWNEKGRKNKLRTSRPNWAAMSTKLASNKEGCNLIDIGDMSHILDVDYKKKLIKCEPGVTMGQILYELAPNGYALQTQVEMESITVGGAALGFGMETNSHVVGFFQESVVAYEIITSTGEILNVTAKNDPDLFYAIPWSSGTLGFLVSLTIKIIPIKPYVLIKYVITNSPQELCDKMTTASESSKPPTFLEATLYSKDVSVIQMGYLQDEPIGEDRKLMNSINSFWKPFYYKHVETFIAKGGGEEIVPLYDYYNRFTRSIFWELEDMIPFSNHWLYRCLWGWMGAPEVSLLKLAQGPVIRKASVYAHVVQESIMPVRNLAEGVEKFDNWFGVYPLLVFPLRVYDRGEHSGMLSPQKRSLAKGKDWGIWVDLGAYGAPRLVKEGKMWDPKENVREMEHWTRDKGGWQACYTDLFCTPKEFKQMFNHTLWEKMRKRLDCDDAFPEVYDKVKPEAGIVMLDDIIAQEFQQDFNEEDRSLRIRQSRSRSKPRGSK